MRCLNKQAETRNANATLKEEKKMFENERWEEEKSNWKIDVSSAKEVLSRKGR